jgi:hypothetical protein
MPLGLGLMMGLGHNVAASGGGGGLAAATFNPTTGVNKHADLTLSSGNLHVAPGFAGGFEGVRASRAAQSGLRQVDFTLDTADKGWIGIEDGTTDLSVDNADPSSSTKGMKALLRVPTSPDGTRSSTAVLLTPTMEEVPQHRHRAIFTAS